MEEKIYEVTIPLDDYKELLIESFMFDDITTQLAEIISNANLDYTEKDLYMCEDLKRLCKKYCPKFFQARIEKLKEEEENE